VRAAATGDRHAFGILGTRHQASVYRLARLLVREPADAEDVLQQTFLAAWRAIAQFRGDASVRTWLLTIARNNALTARARAGREPVEPWPDIDPEAIADLGVRAGWGTESPEDLAIAVQRTARLGAALARLSTAEREILTMRDLEGLSGEETATLLGLTLAAMKSRLHRARLTLLAAVREEGIDAA
jgi:RNA polymerase sigma-70 factor (ECF subfamily)